MIILFSLDQELYNLTQEIVGINNGLGTLCWNEYPSVEDSDIANMIIILDFERDAIEKEVFKKIIEIRGKIRGDIPLLAILRNPSSQDIFSVLTLGAFDYLDKKNLDKDYKKKIEDIIQWQWYQNKCQKNKK